MLQIDARYQTVFGKLGLTTTHAIVEFFREANPKAGTGVFVRCVTLDQSGSAPLTVFYKQYEYQPASWSFLGRASKAQREYRNYAVFRALDVACPDAIAIGEERDGLGRLRRAFIITRAIPDALTLPMFVEQQKTAGIQSGGSGGHRQSVRPILRRQLAAFTRRIHDARFFHHDLHWRNVLVTGIQSDAPKLWWIDCPRGAFGRWARWRDHRRQIKDLACLDKAASKYSSRAERVAFIRDYLKEKRLGPAGKRLVREVLAYRRVRWPEDWEGR